MRSLWTSRFVVSEGRFSAWRHAAAKGRSMARPLRVRPWLELLRLWPFRVLLVEAQMPVVHRRELPLDKEVFHVRGQFERVAVRHDEVGELALLERPDLSVQAKNPRGIQRDGLERFLIRQAVRDGVSRVLSQSPRQGIIEARKGELHPGCGKLRGL